MGYILTEEGRSLVNLVRNFCEKEVKENCKQYDVIGEVPMDTIRKAADMQLHILDMPVEYGGVGLDLITSAAIG